MSDIDATNKNNKGEQVKSNLADKPAQPVATSKKKANILLAGLYAIIGVIFIGAIALVVFRSESPNFRSALDQAASVLEGKAGALDQVLERTVRYPRTGSLESKDWRRDMLTEQTIWTDELTRVNLGTSDAKPYGRRRQFLLYLGDSYYRDEPRFDQARAVYINATLEPKSGSKQDFDIEESELQRRIGYCSLRLGDFEIAEKYLKSALALCDLAKAAPGKPNVNGNLNAALDNLTEVYARQGKISEAQAIINRRLKAIDLKDPSFCVEPHLLFNVALIKEKAGDFVGAEKYYQKTISQFRDDGTARGTIAFSDNDNDRNLARALREYARFLRTQNRPDESFESMKQAFMVLDRAP
ncbi:MAG: hypothetical protein IPP57_08955 [Candidatus Obscuribacter sp.]|nr:hypothetical protein [Candidatus Obscuribacter sp.]